MDLWVKAKINPFPKNIISISDDVNIVDVVFIVVFFMQGLKKNEFSDNKDSFERDGLDASSYIFLVGICGKNSQHFL